MTTLLPHRIEGIRSARPASDDVLRMCASERDAFLVSVQLSGLTYEEIGARIGVSKQGVHKWREQGVPHKRTQAFCNATGTLLVIQFREFEKAMRVAQGRVREADRIHAIARLQVAA